MARLEKEKVSERIYYDVDEGFGSVTDLYEKTRKVGVGITLDIVSTWMRAQPNKQTRNYKNYNSYTAPFPKYEFQIDLMDVTSLLRDVGSEIRNQLYKICFNMRRYFQQKMPRSPYREKRW